MTKYFLFFFLSFFSSYSLTQVPCNDIDDFKFEIKEQEKGALQYFNEKAKGVDNINVFILAKMTELMYPERLDYQLRYLKDSNLNDTLKSSEVLLDNPIVNENNFECAFTQRFKHMFPKKENVQFKFIHETYKKGALGYSIIGFDPELMVISTKNTIFIIYRGTDGVQGDNFAEWTGTDFKVGMKEGDGPLKDIKLHKGFWGSFVIIRNELIQTLQRFDAKNKQIWIAGHSLGGAMSILTGTYLKGEGYPVQNVYTYASPRTIGGKKFRSKAKELLPNQIHRFEYYLDPIPILGFPGYKNNGQRNWYEHVDSNYMLHQNIRERFYTANPTEFRRIPFVDKRTKLEVKKHRRKLSALITDYITKVHYHNPQWYVKAAYEQLTKKEKEKLPFVDDSFPFLYYGAKFGK